MNGNPQTDYSLNLAPRTRGGKVDSRTSVVESHAAVEQILFGDPLMGSDVGDGVRLPKRNRATAIFSGALVTSNVTNGKVNGVALAPVTFVTDSPTTLALIAAEIDAALLLQGITAVSTVSGTTITTNAKDASVTFSDFVVTAGSGQATVSHTYIDSSVFRGVAEMVQKELAAPGVAGYEEGYPVSTFRRGMIAVQAKGAVAKDTAIYAVIATSGFENCFTTTSTGNGSIVGKSRSAAADGDLFDAEFNLP